VERYRRQPINKLVLSSRNIRGAVAVLKALRQQTNSSVFTPELRRLIEIIFAAGGMINNTADFLEMTGKTIEGCGFPTGWEQRQEAIAAAVENKRARQQQEQDDQDSTKPVEQRLPSLTKPTVRKIG